MKCIKVYGFKFCVCYYMHVLFLFFLHSMNRLSSLPRGFGSLPALEVLDLTYNNMNQNSLPGNFFYLSKWTHTLQHVCIQYTQDAQNLASDSLFEPQSLKFLVQ